MSILILLFCKDLRIGQSSPARHVACYREEIVEDNSKFSLVETSATRDYIYVINLMTELRIEDKQTLCQFVPLVPSIFRELLQGDLLGINKVKTNFRVSLFHDRQ